MSMKTTIELNDELYRRLKSTAALRGKKVRELVEEGVKAVLQPSWKPAEQGRKVEFPIIKAKGKKRLKIPADIAYRVDLALDLESYAKSLR